MAGGPTHDGILYLLNLWRLGETTVTSYYIALTIKPGGFAIVGDDLDEPTDSAYARVEMVNDSDAWNLSGLMLSNAYQMAFSEADEDWGTIDYWSICDEPTSGRVLFTGQFTEPLYVEATDTVIVEPGGIAIDMAGNQWQLGG